MIVMMRFLLRAIVTLTLLFSALVMVVRAKPYDDGGLRAVLFASNCQPPCFMGIYPGVTTRDQAIRLLQTNPWVASIDTIYNDEGLTWAWNGQQPAFLRGGSTENHLLLHAGIVARIDLLTWDNTATFAILFGAPQAWYYSTWSISDPRRNVGLVTQFEQHAAYGSIEVAASGLCPLTIKDQWALPTQISMPGLADHAGYGVSLRAIPMLPERCR